MRFSTKAIHVGQKPNVQQGGSGDVVVPLHLSTTFARREVDVPTRGYEYSRSGNPTRDVFEQVVASLEGAEHGLAYSSGLAATDNVLRLLKQGDHVIAFDDLYGGSRRLFTQIWEQYGISFSFVDMRDSTNVKMALRDTTRMIWIETPTNPLLRLCDIEGIVDVVRESSLLDRAIVVVDNTFMSPFFQQPLSLGADIVLHSTTKYLGGHSDVVGGVVALNDTQLHERLRFVQNAVGAVASPFDSWLALRGLKTLSLRMRRHAENAQQIATFLESHKRVKRVLYPGLTSYPQHALAKRQMTGMGGVISFEIDGGLDSAKRFLSSLEVFVLAESLGCVESLIEHPAIMTHASVPPEVRSKLGISDTLIRVSVGIEDARDLIEDLEQAL